MVDTHSDKSKEEEFYYLLTEGSELLQGGRVDEARAHFERAVSINNNNEQALNLLGLSLFRLGQLDRAKQIFGELVAANPIEPSLRLNLAMVYLKQAKLDAAHIELERVLELNPDGARRRAKRQAERHGEFQVSFQYGGGRGGGAGGVHADYQCRRGRNAAARRLRRGHRDAVYSPSRGDQNARTEAAGRGDGRTARGEDC